MLFNMRTPHISASFNQPLTEFGSIAAFSFTVQISRRTQPGNIGFWVHSNHTAGSYKLLGSRVRVLSFIG